VASEPPSPAQLIGLGAGIVGFIIFGLVIGLLLDGVLDTSPLFVALGLGLGIVGAAGTLIVQFRAFMKD